MHIATHGKYASVKSLAFTLCRIHIMEKSINGANKIYYILKKKIREIVKGLDQH